MTRIHVSALAGLQLCGISSTLFISQLRPHTVSKTLNCWTGVREQAEGDPVTSSLGDPAALVSSLRPRLRPLTLTCTGRGSTLGCGLGQLFMSYQEGIWLKSRSALLVFLLGNIAFDLLFCFPEPFPASYLTQTFMELTYSLHMLRPQSFNEMQSCPSDFIATISVQGLERC